MVLDGNFGKTEGLVTPRLLNYTAFVAIPYCSAGYMYVHSPTEIRQDIMHHGILHVMVLLTV